MYTVPVLFQMGMECLEASCMGCGIYLFNAVVQFFFTVHNALGRCNTVINFLTCIDILIALRCSLIGTIHFKRPMQITYTCCAFVQAGLPNCVHRRI